MSSKYRSVSIPTDLYNEVKKIVEEDCTYASISEFVREALRFHLRRRGEEIAGQRQ